MAYDISVYVNLRSIPDLESRFKNLEPFVRIHGREYEDIRRAMADKEWGEAKLAELKEKLMDLKLDMENIITAIELLKCGA